jgi:hypothetical protein
LLTWSVWCKCPLSLPCPPARFASQADHVTTLCIAALCIRPPGVVHPPACASTGIPLVMVISIHGLGQHVASLTLPCQLPCRFYMVSVGPDSFSLATIDITAARDTSQKRTGIWSAGLKRTRTKIQQTTSRQGASGRSSCGFPPEHLSKHPGRIRTTATVSVNLNRKKKTQFTKLDGRVSCCRIQCRPCRNKHTADATWQDPQQPLPMPWLCTR